MDLEKSIRAALLTIPGLGSRRLRRLIAVFGSAQAAWVAPREAFESWESSKWLMDMLRLRQEIEPESIREELKVKGIFTVIPNEAHYPRLLAELSDAPPLLYYKGQLPENQEALAIVGSRQATAYGKAAAEYLAKGISAQGIVVVSGLARGIDTSAHKGALAAGGITWAILGCGVDLVYPPENGKLFRDILARGAVISEFAPGTPPDAPHFPARNRIISGCSRGVVVVEAGRKSGALITVDFALEQGREVFAVPGPIFSPMSKGTNHLLRQGAKIVDDIEDILAEIPDWFPVKERNHAGQVSRSQAGRARRKSSLADDSSAILELMSDLPLHIDQIVSQAAIPAEQIPLILLELQLAGEIEQLPGQFYVIARNN